MAVRYPLADCEATEAQIGQGWLCGCWACCCAATLVLVAGADAGDSACQRAVGLQLSFAQSLAIAVLERERDLSFRLLPPELQGRMTELVKLVDAVGCMGQEVSPQLSHIREPKRQEVRQVLSHLEDIFRKDVAARRVSELRSLS